MRITEHYCPRHRKRMIRKLDIWHDQGIYLRCPVQKCRITAREQEFGSRVVSLPAGTKVKDLRTEAHNLSEAKFKSRDDFYDWLKKNSRHNHIGFMFERELVTLISKLKKLNGNS